ncbi:MAG: hypothetical protein V3W08_01175 [Candidatus Binatia bacterium]
MSEEHQTQRLIQILSKELDQYGRIAFLEALKVLGFNIAQQEITCGPDEETHEIMGTEAAAWTKGDAEILVIMWIIASLKVKRRIECASGKCVDEFECSIQILDYDQIHRQLVFNPLEMQGCPHGVGWLCKWPGGDVKSRCTCAPVPV